MTGVRRESEGVVYSVGSNYSLEFWASAPWCIFARGLRWTFEPNENTNSCERYTVIHGTVHSADTERVYI